MRSIDVDFFSAVSTIHPDCEGMISGKLCVGYLSVRFEGLIPLIENKHISLLLRDDEQGVKGWLYVRGDDYWWWDCSSYAGDRMIFAD